MSLEQRIARLEKEQESKAGLPIMVWHEGRREEAFARYLAEHGREPKTEIKICLVACAVNK